LPLLQVNFAHVVASTTSGRHFQTKTEVDNWPLVQWSSQEQWADLPDSALSPLHSNVKTSTVFYYFTQHL